MSFVRFLSRSRNALVRAARPTFARRAFSGDAAVRPAVTSFSEDEEMLRQAVEQFSNTTLRPHVAQMDRDSHMPREVLDALFDNGLMGIEMPEKWGGSGASFTSAILTIEELAKVDPSVSVLVDIQKYSAQQYVQVLGVAGVARPVVSKAHN